MKYEDFCVFEYVEENKCQVIIFDCSNGCESQAAFHAVPSQASSSTPAAATSKGKEKAVEDEGQRRDITDDDSFVPSRASSSTPFAATTSKGKEKAVEDEGKENAVEDEGTAEPHTRPFVSQRRDITDEDSFIALDAALGFESKNLSSLMLMRASHSLPISFCKVILPPNGEAVTVFVKDPYGRAWHVVMAASEDGLFAQLSTGWRDLSYANYIEANDVCIFELVKEDELQLPIFRVVEEIKPLINWLE
ncbi:hypothetical protein C5167_012524 [Papaver somniferum]|uniref:TF-B3 domain-containing protein n=1 Tax=Papaver somniferum TaxID=3469 RepID=A0A4Y7IXP5_PAPSO|nr:hypothetical protein C5167_012524 [Papaver somniferum]